jgi:SpoVK/Ycf46/Vps4 family AAA+-type ATPase
MVNTAFKLVEYQHPNKTSGREYAQLVGIDGHKTRLFQTLDMLLNQRKVTEWNKKHHAGRLSLAHQVLQADPLIILSGEVGCGKTALAQSIATPLSEELGKRIRVFETPSDIRGNGLVGEISSRITAAFDQVLVRTKDEEISLLIIDEADDLATSREQNQAHHEDRAGLNVLIKQLDLLKKSEKRIVVLMITNRIAVIDPAVQRRCSLHLTFERPSSEHLKGLFSSLLQGIKLPEREVNQLLHECEVHSVRYTASDIVHRVGKGAVYEAISDDQPLTVDRIIKWIRLTPPTPLLQKASIQ